MRRKLFLTIIFCFGFLNLIYAESVNVTFQIQEVGIEITGGDTINFGQLDVDTPGGIAYRYETSCTSVCNVGNWTVDLKLKVSAQPGLFAVTDVATQLVTDTAICRLRAVTAASIPATDQIATIINVAPTETTYDLNLSQGTTTHFWWRIDLPYNAPATTDQSATITITAQE